MKKILISVFAVFAFFQSSVSFSAFFPPRMEVYTVKTEHFYIHYPVDQAQTAEDLAEIAERVHARLSEKLKWKPWGRTHLVLTDTTDRANGLASVIPSNYILLYVTSPDADSSLDHYNNYLELLFTHEYTHILHMDQHFRWADPPHWVLGKIVAPNGLTPGWMREGIAAWEETVETGRGRGKSSYSDMLLRMSILEDKFPSIDKAAGLGTGFPGTDAQYIYGVKFWQWLAEKYGEEKIQQYMEKYASGLWLFSINNKARRVYGKSFYKLWREWKKELSEKYTALRLKLSEEGLTPFSPFPQEALKKNLFHSYPTPHPSGGYAYVEESLDSANRIVVAFDGEQSRTGKKDAKPDFIRRTVSGQLAVSKDGGSLLAFSSLSGVEPYHNYTDIYVYDIAKKTSKRVFPQDGKKKSLRATDPDFSPIDGGRFLIMVRTASGTDNLYLYDLKEKKGSYLTDSPPYTQFSNPRFSPDGGKIAVSRRDHGGNRDIVLYTEKGRVIKKITEDEANDNHPAWSPDGSSIYFESDYSGIPNIYRYDLSTNETIRVSNVLGGVYQPQITPDGKNLLVKYYTSGGYSIYHVPVENLGATGSAQQSSRGEPMCSPECRGGVTPPKMGAEIQPTVESPFVNDAPLPGSKKYGAFPQILVPRYIVPTFLTLDDAFLFGLSTGRFDPLYRHSWSIYTNYRTDAGFVGGGGSYIYRRYNPSLYAGFSRYALNWGNLFGDNRDFFEERIQGFGGVFWGLGRHGISAGYFFENRDNFSAIPAGFALPTLDNYAGIRTDYVFSRYRRFPRSISQEDGPLIKIGFDITDSVLGSAGVNEQMVLNGDLRYYIELPWADHHVLGFRTAGGFVWEDKEFSGTFRFGGPFGEGNLAGYSSRLFPFRGLPGVTFAGDRVLLFSTEYRLPIAEIDRGIGTLPVFFKKIYMTFFGDYGDSWLRNGKDGRNFFEDFFLSAGTELKGDLIIGYGLPLTARAGYGIILLNRDRVSGLKDSLFGNDIRFGSFYFQFGTSF